MSSLGIAIPTYNREEQLASLLKSIPEHIPVHISDNGACLTGKFRKAFPYVNISTVTGSIIPPFENWNRAARMVTQEWVIIPSDDDIYYPDSFAEICGHIDRHRQADMLIFGHNVVDEGYRITSRWAPEKLIELPAPSGFEHVKYGVNARMPSIVFRRRLLEKIGFFDEDFKVTAGDSFMIQKAALSGRTVLVPLVVSGYRVWSQGATQGVISTPEWMKEIEQWGEKLEQQLMAFPQYVPQVKRIRAEIYARGLHAGLNHLRRKGLYKKTVQHFLAADFPWQATRLTCMKLIYQLVRPSM